LWCASPRITTGCVLLLQWSQWTRSPKPTAPAPTADAATAVYWLTHPEIAAATVNTLTALLDKWESEPEWTGPPEGEDEDECQE
jgi:hypothetical protein